MKITTEKYLNNHGVTDHALTVNNVEEHQTSTTEQNIELLKGIDFQQKKLALVNEQIKIVLLILSILWQVVKIVPVMVPVAESSTDSHKNVELSTIELGDNYINTK